MKVKSPEEREAEKAIRQRLAERSAGWSSNKYGATTQGQAHAREVQRRRDPVNVAIAKAEKIMAEMEAQFPHLAEVGQKARARQAEIARRKAEEAAAARGYKLN